MSPSHLSCRLGTICLFSCLIMFLSIFLMKTITRKNYSTRFITTSPRLAQIKQYYYLFIEEISACIKSVIAYNNIGLTIFPLISLVYTFQCSFNWQEAKESSNVKRNRRNVMMTSFISQHNDLLHSKVSHIKPICLEMSQVCSIWRSNYYTIMLEKL